MGSQQVTSQIPLKVDVSNVIVLIKSSEINAANVKPAFF
jgi:hypothetical protein